MDDEGVSRAVRWHRVVCAGDLDGDSDVGVSDLLALLAAWGTPAGDVNGDGATDVADLLALLSAWGPCA